ncbi:DUF302 domain-containing protein [Mycolicibacterium celeriflavum]|uniref:DUF302 domain-containing protein n=1 Tax=Mycolicibacterium celeriflavum TaxID=1249101 RepID=UPI003CEA08A3
MTNLKAVDVQPEPCVTRFDGVRLRYDSTRSFDELVAAVFAEVGDRPVPLEDIARRYPGWEEFAAEVESHAGPTGFMLIARWDHGGWLAKAGIDRRVLRLVIGNPLIAITMLRHDVTAGLFAPVELLLTDEQNGHSALTYVAPSSLMVVEPNESLRKDAEELDAKLATLASKVTGATSA